MKTPRFLQYIETNGQQYIDTGIEVTGKTAVEMSARITTPTANWDTLFGTRDGNTRRFTMRFGNSANGELQVQFSTNSNYQTSYDSWNTGMRKNQGDSKWSNFELDAYYISMAGIHGKAYVTWWEGTTLHAPIHEFKTGPSASYPASLYLGACHDASAGAIDFAHMQIQSCFIYSYGEAHKYGEPENSFHLMRVAVRAYFPALDEEGRACLYDAVSDSYFYSPNENEFIAGPPISQVLFRVNSRDIGYTPERRLRSVESAEVPDSSFRASAGYGHPDNGWYDPEYEFVGYDTDPEAFTAVYKSRDDTSLPGSLSGQVLDVYAVWKHMYGYLVKDGNGVFYTKDYTGARVNLGVKELCAKTFEDYAFQGYPGSDMLTDLLSPSIYNWTKQIDSEEEGQIYYKAPAVFDVTLKGVPPLPQLMTYPTQILRKRLAYVTIPADPDGTRWNVSFDAGETWYKYEGGWIQVTDEGDGCEKRKLEILDTDDWTPMLVNNSLRFRAWIRKNGWISSIRIEYRED